ncbi:MAG: hypothetical protein RQ899_06920 [Pseudomonadales bacterium]|nr:hypothetical protein [Pseudomonadales bacterium]
MANSVNPATTPRHSDNYGAQNPKRRSDILARLAQFKKLIGNLELDEGPYTDQLTENLLSAALLYQALDEHSSALDYLNKAQHVSRINRGLDTLEQVPILQARRDSYLALGELEKADAAQEALFTLQQELYGNDNPDLIPALKALGEWNQQAFLDRSNILLNIPRIDLQSFLNDVNNYRKNIEDTRTTPLFKLYQAQQNFQQAINIAIKQRAFDHPDLMTLERLLLTSYLLHAHRENILYEPDFYLSRKKTKTGSRLNHANLELRDSDNYRMGQDSFKRRISYLKNKPQPEAQELVNILFETADWHLLFGHKVVAADAYQQAYDLLLTDPEAAVRIQTLLYPETPVILPIYLPPPNSREKLGISAHEEVNFFAYFDVSFAIDKFGKAKNITILDKAGDISKNTEIRFQQYLAKVLFRPRFKDGKPDTAIIFLRYSVGA